MHPIGGSEDREGLVVSLTRNGMAVDGADEATLRVRQDEEFCRILRAVSNKVMNSAQSV